MTFLKTTKCALSEQEQALAHYTAKIERCIPSLQWQLKDWRKEDEDLWVRNFTCDTIVPTPHTRYASLLQQVDFRQKLADAAARLFERHNLGVEAHIVSSRYLRARGCGDCVGSGYELRAKSTSLPFEMRNKYANVQGTSAGAAAQVPEFPSNDLNLLSA